MTCITAKIDNTQCRNRRFLLSLFDNGCCIMHAHTLNASTSIASKGNGIVALAPLTPHIQHAEELISNSHRRRYPSKSTIIYAGDTSDTLYYIIKGSVTVAIEDDDGKESFVLGRCFPLSDSTLVDSPRVFFFPFSLETLNGSSCSSPVKLITMEQERKDKSPPQPTGCMYCEMKFTKITQRKTFFC